MYAYDFEYDGKKLSEFNFIIGDYDDSSGEKTVKTGYQISFNTVPRHSGKIFSLTSTKYEECIAVTFQIFKDPCKDDNSIISEQEYFNIVRWLNRREFLKLKFIYEEPISVDCYYNASFNTSKILCDGKLIGIELAMETDKPFGYGDVVESNLNFTSDNSSLSVEDLSHEIGYTYPDMVITCNSSGNLTITNGMTNSSMTIKNVTQGEIITIYGQAMIIESSLNSHKIMNDFNWEFLKIQNTYNNNVNIITSTIPCSIKISYIPIIKNVPDL